MSQESKDKVSKSKKGVPSKQKGKKHTEESKKNMSEGSMGKIHTKETKIKLSTLHSGKKNPRYRNDIDINDIKKLIEQGLTRNKIAKLMGTTFRTIDQRLKIDNNS